MKSIRTSPRKLTFRPCFSGVILTAILPVAASADPLFWNPGGTGGDGIWGTGPGERNWNAISGADAGNVAWPEIDGQTAVFSDMVGGVVTVFDVVGLSGLRLDGADYQLFGGTLIPSDAASPIEIVVNGDRLSINSEIAGAAGITMQGPGTLVLQGSNAFTGPLSLNGGTIVLEGSLSNTTIVASPGSELVVASGSLPAGASFTNSGTLRMATNSVISTYTSNGGSLVGMGRLSAQSMELNDGSFVSASVLTPRIVTNGEVEIGLFSVSGSVQAVESFDVNSGTLTNQGNLVSPLITIQDGAVFVNEGSIRSNFPSGTNTAVVNSGTFVSRKSPGVSDYTSNGGILDVQAQRLTLANAYLNDGSITLGGTFSATALVTNGAVRIENNILGRSAEIQSGEMTLNGRLSHGSILISDGASLRNQAGGLSSSTALTNTGTLFTGADDTIASYTSNGGLLDGPGVLTVSGAAELNDGSSVVGSLIADSILSHGGVEISGSATAPMASVQTGTLTLTGLLDAANLGISSGATLENMSGGLADPTALTNAGTLFMGADDTIARYISNGGRITGPGLLTIGEVVLNDGSVVGGRLAANQLTTHGRVQLDGQTRTGRVDVRSGALINRGSLHTGILNIASGAAFVPRGWQSYGLLTTSGPGTAYWLGHLRNRAGVAPGGIGGIGRLMVAGNFTNTPRGTLYIDLAGRGGDMLLVGGTARLGGTLELNQVGNITPFVSIPIITAGAYEGNFHTMRADTSRPVWFNPATGSVMALREANPRTNSGIWGANANQTAVWVSLYDDVVDPGRTNITRDGSRGYRILGGLGDHKRPELLHALAASFTPTGLNPVVLDRLSPEAYAGLQDHAIHATRSMTRSASNSPAIHTLRQASGPESRVEVFAAFDTFRSPSGVEGGPADYRPSGHGFLAGLRAHLRSGLVVGAWGGVHDGEVKGSLLDADASGMALGLFARARVHEPTATELEVGLGYGKYEYDGRRGGLRANAEGWRPTGIGFRNVDAEALHAYIDLSATIWQDDTLRIIPNVSLLSTWGNRDGFSEHTRGGGDAVGLVLDSDTYRASFVEAGLRTEVDLSDSIEAHILGGASLALDRSPHNLTARFASGDRPMRLSSEGINQDSLFIGLGTVWRPTRDLAFGAHWRADFRRSGDTNHQLGLGGAITF